MVLLIIVGLVVFSIYSAFVIYAIVTAPEMEETDTGMGFIVVEDKENQNSE